MAAVTAGGAGPTGGAGELRTQLEKARQGLQRLEKDIRRAAVINDRHHTDRNNDRSFQSNANNARGGPRLGKGNFSQDNFNQRNFSDERQPKKRPQETKTVFSRLSARPTGDSDVEDEVAVVKKPRLSSQVIRDLPTKQEVLKAQEGDEQSKARNRRMFGSLLGTLQKFKQESIVLQNKEDKKAQVERKIEEQAKLEKENQKKERQNLFAEREIKKATIKALEAKMVRMREFEKWEAAHTMMLGFIQTKGKPSIYWKPKRMSENAQEKLNSSRKNLERIMEKKRQDVTFELNNIEQRCLRNIRLPPGSQQRPVSLSESGDLNNSYIDNDNVNNDDSNPDDSYEEPVQRSSVVVKKEKDDSDRKPKIKSEAQSVQINKEDKNIENGKTQTNEKWNRDESQSSSENEDNHSDGHKSTNDAPPHVDNENGEDDPGGVEAANQDAETTEGDDSNVKVE